MVSEEYEDNTTENQRFKQTHYNSKQRIYVSQIETIHKLYNHISNDNKKYGNEYEKCKECKNECHINVVDKLQKYGAQRPVKQKGTKKPQSKDEE
jgi:hypothetical protein